MASKQINETYEKLFQFYIKKFPHDSPDTIRELIEIDVGKQIEKGKSREEAILQILEHFETIAQQIKNYEKAIKKLAILFAKGEISEETYKTSVQSLEEKVSDLKQTEKEHVIFEVKKGVDKPFEPTVPKITATHIIVGVIVFLLIFGAIFYFSIPKERTVRFTIRIESNTDWAGSIGADGSSWTIEGYGSETRKVTGTIAVAVIQKQTDYGYLTVTILRDEKVLDSQTTTAAYGVVSVSASG